MVLDALPDEDFSSYTVRSVCAAAALSCEQTGFALTWKKSPPVSGVNWAFTSCKLCTDGLTAADGISSSAQRALPLTAKSLCPLRASAITSPPTQTHWKHWHSAQTQGEAMKGRLSKLPPHGESSLILFSGRDKFFRSWTLMTIANTSELRIFCDSVIFDHSLLTGSESKFSLS